MPLDECIQKFSAKWRELVILSVRPPVAFSTFECDHVQMAEFPQGAIEALFLACDCMIGLLLDEFLYFIHILRAIPQREEYPQGQLAFFVGLLPCGEQFLFVIHVHVSILVVCNVYCTTCIVQVNKQPLFCQAVFQIPGGSSVKMARSLLLEVTSCAWGRPHTYIIDEHRGYAAFLSPQGRARET